MNASSIELTSCPVYEIESRAPTYFSKGRQIAPDENVFKIQRCRMIEFFECSVWPHPPIHYVLRYNFNRFHKKKTERVTSNVFPWKGRVTKEKPAHYLMSIRSKVIYWTRLTSTRKEHAAVREGDSREQNFRFQRRDIEVAIHRSVQSGTSLPFFFPNYFF